MIVVVRKYHVSVSVAVSELSEVVDDADAVAKESDVDAVADLFASAL